MNANQHDWRTRGCELGVKFNSDAETATLTLCLGNVFIRKKIAVPRATTLHSTNWTGGLLLTLRLSTQCPKVKAGPTTPQN